MHKTRLTSAVMTTAKVALIEGHSADDTSCDFLCLGAPAADSVALRSELYMGFYGQGPLINKRHDAFLPARKTEPLPLQILFNPRDDRLSKPGTKALTTLALFLTENPELLLQLDGYADPRGTDEYNNVLSHYRAHTVLSSLATAGINPLRVRLKGHGAKAALSTASNRLAYALERRVDIQIINRHDKHNTQL